MRQNSSGSPVEAMLTIRQVADLLHVSMSTARRWSDSGILRSYRFGPRGDRRYAREDVVSFVEKSTYYSQPNKPRVGSHGEGK